MKKGTRVYHSYLGEGTVVETDKCLSKCGFVLVLWDKNPDVNYNLGGNPTAKFQGDLKTIKSKCKKPCDIGEE